MRRLWLILLFVIVCLAGADFAFWRVAIVRLQKGFDAWAAAETRAGWTVSAGKPVPGGWPLAATLTLPDLTLTAADTALPVPVTWRTDEAALRLDLVSPTTLRIVPSGQESIRLGSGPAVPYTAENLALSIPLAGQGSTVRAELSGGGIRGLKGDRVDASGFGIALLSAHLEATPGAAAGQTALAWELAAESVTVRPGAASPLVAAFGDRMPSVVFEGTLSGPLPPPGDPAERARQWRDAGGRLGVSRFVLGWGTLGLHGRGTFSLDDALQPAGSGEVEVIDYPAALDSLAHSHAIGTGAVVSARAVLSVVSHAQDNSDERAADLSFELKDRTLSVEQFPLAKVARLQLP
jgi:hypothetical protein